MPYYIRLRDRLVLPGIATVLVLILGAGDALAQIQPGGMGGGLGPTQPSGEEKKEGVAEAAPKTPGLLPTTPALPAPKGRRKRWKLFEIDGYFRFRTDWFKNFHLGFLDDPALGGAPFPRALGCTSLTAGSECDNTLSSSNMRLRLEPTINLDEGTSIHIQADVLDNLVLGSTPVTGAYGQFSNANPPPVGAFGNGQEPPVAGVNGDRDAIQIKRAWAEVAVPLGILKVGRMPNHWGMGMFSNGGGHDPISGSYDLDGDLGDSVDRASFSALIPGTNLRAMVASDWVVTRLVSNQTDAGKGREGHPWDLDDNDDANAWVVVLSRMDSPQEFRDRVDRGGLTFNYGIYFEYKTQKFDDSLVDFDVGGAFNGVNYRARGLKTYTPDLWGKLGIGRFTFEAELVAQLGTIDSLEHFNPANSEVVLTGADVRKYGGTGRITWRGLDGKLRLGVEGGFASGDQWDNVIPGRTHVAYANQVGGSLNPELAPDGRLSQFIFNREYKIDMILFRHLIGAVTNAGYAKPFLSYDLTKSIQFRVANITSFALKPIATPGNTTMYGTEFNGDLGYNSGGVFAGISYGVLFPFGAMAHPDADDEGNTFGFVNDPELGDNTGDAGTAHTIQTRLVLRF